MIGHFKTALERQVSESVRIERTGAVRILNSKMEYSRSTLPRIKSVDVEPELTLGDSDRVVENEDEMEEGTGCLKLY